MLTNVNKTWHEHLVQPQVKLNDIRVGKQRSVHRPQRHIRNLLFYLSKRPEDKPASHGLNLAAIWLVAIADFPSRPGCE